MAGAHRPPAHPVKTGMVVLVWSLVAFVIVLLLTFAVIVIAATISAIGSAT